MRESGVRGVLVYCSDYHCSHHIEMSADPGPDHIRLSDLEPRFICTACGRRGADIRPDFHWDRAGVLTRGFWPEKIKPAIHDGLQVQGEGDELDNLRVDPPLK